MNEEVMSPIPRDSVLGMSWHAWRQTEEFARTRYWAHQEDHLDGSLWNAYRAGFDIAVDAVLCSLRKEETLVDLLDDPELRIELRERLFALGKALRLRLQEHQRC